MSIHTCTRGVMHKGGHAQGGKVSCCTSHTMVGASLRNAVSGYKQSNLNKASARNCNLLVTKQCYVRSQLMVSENMYINPHINRGWGWMGRYQQGIRCHPLILWNVQGRPTWQGARTHTHTYTNTGCTGILQGYSVCLIPQLLHTS